MTCGDIPATMYGMTALTHIVLGDLHNRLDKTREVLAEAGAITVNSGDPMTDVRNPGFWIIQLGDAVSLGYDEDEAYFLKWFYQVVQPDETLIGNHELPAVFWDPASISFFGYEPEVDQRGHQIWKIGADPAAKHMVISRYNEGKLKAATSLGKWLLTHAGVSIKYQHKHKYLGVDPAEVAADLNGRFQRCQYNRVHDDVISSPLSHVGGIFWLRAEYLQAGYREIHMPQIFGHSGYAGPKQDKSGNLWCIDTPGPTHAQKRDILASGSSGLTRGNLGGVCALVTKDEGETFERIYVPAHPDMER